MAQKMSWEDMKKIFPDEWLMIVDCDEDEQGRLIAGVVERHSRNDQEVFNPATPDRDCTFKYTGESKFTGGWRAHAEHHGY